MSIRLNRKWRPAWAAMAFLLSGSMVAPAIAASQSCGAGVIQAMMINVKDGSSNSNFWFALDNSIIEPADAMTGFIQENNMSFIRVDNYDNTAGVTFMGLLAAVQSAFLAGTPVATSATTTSCKFGLKPNVPSSLGFATCGTTSDCNFVPTPD